MINTLKIYDITVLCIETQWQIDKHGLLFFVRSNRLLIKQKEILKKKGVNLDISSESENELEGEGPKSDNAKSYTSFMNSIWDEEKEYLESIADKHLEKKRDPKSVEALKYLRPNNGIYDQLNELQHNNFKIRHSISNKSHLDITKWYVNQKPEMI